MAAETKIIISAATAQAESALRSLGSSVDGMSRKFFDLKSVAGTLGGALTITAFAGFIKSSIDAADNLNDLAQKTGIGIEALAGWKLAADQSGTSLESVAKGIKGLSGYVVDHADKLKKLGITATDSNGIMVQLADVFAKLPDGITKSKLAVDVFGKAGMDMIPMLNLGSHGLADAQEKAAEYGRRMKELAPDADKFNDHLAELSLQANLFGISLAGSVMPELVQISRGMADAAREGGLLNGTLVGLALTYNALFTDDLLPRTQQIGKRLDALQRRQMDRTRDPTSIWFNKDAKNRDNEEMLALQRELEQLREKQKPSSPLARTPEQAAADILKQREFDAQVRKIIGDDKGGKKPKTDPNASAVAAMQDEAFRKEMETMDVAAAQVKVYELAKKGATQAQIESAQASAGEIISIEMRMNAEKDSAKTIKQAQDDMQRSALEAQKIIADIDPIYKAQLAWEHLTELVDAHLLTAEQAGQEYAKSFGETTDQMTVYAEQAGKNIQDAFAEFLFDPFKGGLSGMLDGFQTMLRKMAAEAIASNVLSSVGAWGKSGGGAGSFFGNIAAEVFAPKALGGPVSAGTSYLVGERGPELFTPAASGNITPNDKMGRGITVVNNFTLNQPADRRTQEQIAAMAGASIQNAMMRGA